MSMRGAVLKAVSPDARVLQARLANSAASAVPSNRDGRHWGVSSRAG